VKGCSFPGASLLGLAPTRFELQWDCSTLVHSFRRTSRKSCIHAHFQGMAGRDQRQFEGGCKKSCVRSMPPPSPRVAGVPRAQGSHPQWNFRTRY